MSESSVWSVESKFLKQVATLGFQGEKQGLTDLQNIIKKAPGYNHWPNPVAWVVDLNVLMCNDDYWLASLELSAALLVDWFWTNIVPGPRELERKALLGGYRCGFYLDIKVKSPVEVIFGKDSTLLIGEIAKPFVTGLFWTWAVAGTEEALQSFETVLYPELFCVPSKGVALTANGSAPIVQGHNTGTTAFPEIKYDPFNVVSPLSNVFAHGVGDYDCTFTWFISAGTVPVTNVEVGWDLDGAIQIEAVLGNLGAGQTFEHVSHFRGTFANSGAVSPYFECDSAVRVVPGSATNVRCILTKWPH